jgi:hypothetical protein
LGQSGPSCRQQDCGGGPKMIHIGWRLCFRIPVFSLWTAGEALRRGADRLT